ncbi:MAG: hypothetical protein WBA35_07405 [Litorimonas sp.]
MANHKTANGGGYGNPGEYAQSDLQARAQRSDGDTVSPSATMAQDFAEDGHVSTLAGLTDGDTTPRPQAHNGQSQIAYDTEEE